MNDVYLDPVSGDLPAYTRATTASEYLRQKVYIRLNTFTGEWPLDTDHGLPYLDWLQAKPFPAGQARDFIRKEIEDIDGIDRTEDVTSQFNNETGTFTFSCHIVTEDEQTFILNTASTSFGVRYGTQIPAILTPGPHYFLFHVYIAPVI